MSQPRQRPPDSAGFRRLAALVTRAIWFPLLRIVALVPGVIPQGPARATLWGVSLTQSLWPRSNDSPTGSVSEAPRARVAEPVPAAQVDDRTGVGHIKKARGVRRSPHRGMRKVRAEWRLVCTTYDVLKLAAHRALSTRAALTVVDWGPQGANSPQEGPARVLRE